MASAESHSPRPKKFSARRTPLLSAGTTMKALTVMDNMWLHLKVYSTGGENALHCHPVEDHAFFVLQGEATFVDCDGNETAVREYEGIEVPRGALYRFRSTGEENLVLLRAGGAEKDKNADPAPSGSLPSATLVRRGPSGEEQPATSAMNKVGAERPVIIPNEFFADI